MVLCLSRICYFLALFGVMSVRPESRRFEVSKKGRKEGGKGVERDSTSSEITAFGDFFSRRILGRAKSRRSPDEFQEFQILEWASGVLRTETSGAARVRSYDVRSDLRVC